MQCDTDQGMPQSPSRASVEACIVIHGTHRAWTDLDRIMLGLCRSGVAPSDPDYRRCRVLHDEPRLSHASRGRGVRGGRCVRVLDRL
eukprot:2417857-Rhodomonas_salina.1